VRVKLEPLTEAEARALRALLSITLDSDEIVPEEDRPVLDAVLEKLDKATKKASSR
jgi:hypothetical protein